MRLFKGVDTPVSYPWITRDPDLAIRPGDPRVEYMAITARSWPLMAAFIAEAKGLGIRWAEGFVDQTEESFRGTDSLLICRQWECLGAGVWGMAFTNMGTWSEFDDKRPPEVTYDLGYDWEPALSRLRILTQLAAVDGVDPDPETLEIDGVLITFDRALGVVHIDQPMDRFSFSAVLAAADRILSGGNRSQGDAGDSEIYW